jgi:hypothetical protein
MQTSQKKKRQSSYYSFIQKEGSSKLTILNDLNKPLDANNSSNSNSILPIKISPEYASLIPALTPIEYESLKRAIKENGFRDPAKTR